MHVDQTTNGWLFTCINIIYVVINGCVWAAVQPLGYSLKFVSWNTGRKREMVRPGCDGHGFRTCPTIQCCLHHTELPVFTLSCSSLSRDENNSWRYNHTILILAFAWIQKNCYKDRCPRNRVPTNQPFSVPLEPSSQQNPTMVNCKEIYRDFKGFQCVAVIQKLRNLIYLISLKL